MIVFVVAQAFWLSRYLEEEPKTTASRPASETPPR
jgi:hypothetical protein